MLPIWTAENESDGLKASRGVYGISNTVHPLGSCSAPDGRSGAEFSPSSASTTLPRRHLGPEAPPPGRVLDTIFASAAPSPAGDCTHASAPIPAPAASDHHQYHCERHGGDTPHRKPEQQMQLLHKHICSCSRHRWPLVAGEASKSLLLLSHRTNSCSARQARTMVLESCGSSWSQSELHRMDPTACRHPGGGRCFKYRRPGRYPRYRPR